MTPQELKASILQLAIQGKLVEQRPEEGTGAELLAKILAAKNASNNLTRRRGERGGGAALSPGKISAHSAPPHEEILDAPFDIPESWVWVRLGELLKVISGVSYDKKDVCNTGFRILRGGNIQNMEILLDAEDVFLPEQYRDDEKIVRVGDILIVASTGSKTVIGKAGYVDKPIPQTMIGAFLRICRPSSLEFVGYLRLIFESDFYRKHIRELSQGTNINNIKEAYISQFAIPFPPLAEQKRIVAKTEELLPLIDRYEKAWGKLEDFNRRFPVDMQKSLLQMAIQGKLVEQRPDEGTGAELLAKISAAKNAGKNLTRRRGERGGGAALSLEKTSAHSAPPREEILDAPFDIPESWVWVRLGEICKSIADGDHQPPPQVAAGIPFLVISNVSKGTLDFSNTRFVPLEYFNSLSRERVPEKGDLLFTVTGSYGIPLKIDTDSRFCFQRHMALLKLLTGREYLFYALMSPVVQKQCDNAATGTAQKTVGLNALRNLLIPLPPLAEQKRIVTKLEELLPLCERLK